MDTVKLSESIKDIDIYVWADVNDENYTCKYEVGKFNEEMWIL